MPRSSEPRRGPGRPPGGTGEETRYALLEAARALFSARGYDGVPVRHLAQAAGVNAAMVHYHFGSKAGLYREMLQLAATEVLDRVQAALSHPGTDVNERIESLFRAVMGVMARRPWLPRLIVRDVLAPDGRFRDEFLQRFARPGAGGLLVPWLREAVARGELRGDLDAGFAAVSVMSLAVYPFIALPVAREAAEIDMDQSTLERLVVHNTRLFCQGALPRPGSRDQQHDA
ncbi:MAG TPA: TetR/AcrR family transcriptional regulator [Gammaproteobacteria bacterium]|nr:TetR/AcrR family transcriptional regulator [Gammaproteobacteria bacterium]